MFINLADIKDLSKIIAIIYSVFIYLVKYSNYDIFILLFSITGFR